MFSSTFLKQLFDKRWGTLAWVVGTFLLIVFTVALFHPLRDSLEKTVATLPPSLKGLVGDASSYETIDGFINQQVFIKSMSILGILYGVILFTGLLAGAEGDGTLQVLLSQPISRARVLLEKLAAGVVLTAALSVGVFFACVAGSLLIHEPVHYAGLAVAAVSLWLFVLVFGVFGYMLGAVTGKRGLAGGVTGLLAFVCYLISNLAAGVKSLAAPDKWQPFYYYTRGDRNIITNGLQLKSVTIFVGLIIIWVVIALVAFGRRDIYQA